MKSIVKRYLIVFCIILASFLIQTAVLPRIPYLVAVPRDK